jgi:hypothetical protein
MKLLDPSSWPQRGYRASYATNQYALGARHLSFASTVRFYAITLNSVVTARTTVGRCRRWT